DCTDQTKAENGEAGSARHGTSPGGVPTWLHRSDGGFPLRDCQGIIRGDGVGKEVLLNLLPMGPIPPRGKASSTSLQGPGIPPAIRLSPSSDCNPIHFFLALLSRPAIIEVTVPASGQTACAGCSAPAPVKDGDLLNPRATRNHHGLPRPRSPRQGRSGPGLAAMEAHATRSLVPPVGWPPVPPCGFRRQPRRATPSREGRPSGNPRFDPQ